MTFFKRIAVEFKFKCFIIRAVIRRRYGVNIRALTVQDFIGRFVRAEGCPLIAVIHINVHGIDCLRMLSRVVNLPCNFHLSVSYIFRTQVFRKMDGEYLYRGRKFPVFPHNCLLRVISRDFGVIRPSILEPVVPCSGYVAFAQRICSARVEIFRFVLQTNLFAK